MSPPKATFDGGGDDAQSFLEASEVVMNHLRQARRNLSDDELDGKSADENATSTEEFAQKLQSLMARFPPDVVQDGLRGLAKSRLSGRSDVSDAELAQAAAATLTGAGGDGAGAGGESPFSMLGDMSLTPEKYEALRRIAEAHGSTAAHRVEEKEVVRSLKPVGTVGSGVGAALSSFSAMSAQNSAADYMPPPILDGGDRNMVLSTHPSLGPVDHTWGLHSSDTIPQEIPPSFNESNDTSTLGGVYAAVVRAPPPPEIGRVSSDTLLNPLTQCSLSPNLHSSPLMEVEGTAANSTELVFSPNIAATHVENSDGFAVPQNLSSRTLNELSPEASFSPPNSPFDVPNQLLHTPNQLLHTTSHLKISQSSGALPQSANAPALRLSTAPTHSRQLSSTSSNMNTESTLSHGVTSQPSNYSFGQPSDVLSHSSGLHHAPHSFMDSSQAIQTAGELTSSNFDPLIESQPEIGRQSSDLVMNPLVNTMDTQQLMTQGSLQKSMSMASTSGPAPLHMSSSSLSRPSSLGQAPVLSRMVSSGSLGHMISAESGPPSPDASSTRKDSSTWLPSQTTSFSQKVRACFL